MNAAVESGHAPQLHEKIGSAYTTDDGQEVPSHDLYRYECICGWKGAAWYVGIERARAHFDRHVEASGMTDRYFTQPDSSGGTYILDRTATCECEAVHSPDCPKVVQTVGGQRLAKALATKMNTEAV